MMEVVSYKLVIFAPNWSNYRGGGDGMGCLAWIDSIRYYLLNPQRQLSDRSCGRRNHRINVTNIVLKIRGKKVIECPDKWWKFFSHLRVISKGWWHIMRVENIEGNGKCLRIWKDTDMNKDEETKRARMDDIKEILGGEGCKRRWEINRQRQ